MILRVREAGFRGTQLLRLTFNDFTVKQVDLSPLSDRPIFEPLEDPNDFEMTTLD